MIRSALGAGGGRLARTVLLDGLEPGVAGAFVGVVLGLLVGGFPVGILYNVGAIDLRSLALATILMLSTMLIACIAPTRRALSESPARLLRDDELA